MRRLFRFRYPKLLLFALMVVFAYLFFKNPVVQGFIAQLDGYGLIGVFIAGMLFSFGFSTPFAVGFFVSYTPHNLLLAAILGGLGGVVADLLIFRTIKITFMDEFNLLKRMKPIRAFNRMLKKDLSTKVRAYLLHIFAGIILASPVPDEVGVSMLAGLSHICEDVFVALCFVFKTAGIAVLLLL